MTEESNVGAMCVVLHRERSFHNVDIRILKSALQKYARRAMFSPKGLWCLVELDLFSYSEINPNFCTDKTKLTLKQIQQNVVRIRSNMINRLIAMMSEDVGPCNSYLPNRMKDLYQNWIEHRREPISREVLVQIYQCVAGENVKRIRLLSDLRTVYNLPEQLTKKPDLHRKLLEKFEMNDVIRILYGEECQGKTAKQIYENIIEQLEAKSDLAFAYLSILFTRVDQTWINQHLWTHLIRISPFPASTQALAFFYKTLKHKEHYLYLYHAMTFVIYEDIIRKIDQAETSIVVDVGQLYKDHMKEKIELDAFVFDRHTGATTSRSEFAQEGALVTNECQELLIVKYREMYNEFKVMIDNDENEQKKPKKRKESKEQENTTIVKKKKKYNIHEQLSDVELDAEIVRLGYQLDIKSVAFVDEKLSLLPRGQRRTGAHKKAVFISSHHVYKGPYLASSPGDTTKILRNLYFTRALLALEQHLKVPEELCSIVDWHSVVKIADKNEYYLKQKNMGQSSTSETDSELVSTKVETNVKVLRRGAHVNRLIEIEKEDIDHMSDKKQICLACLQHLYLRYLLSIGDSGTWNILVRRHGMTGVCGVDFEEMRPQKPKKKTCDPLAMIMSKVSKRQRDLYASLTSEILMFKTQIDLSDDLAETLSISLKINVEEMNDRIEEFANCFTSTK